MGAIAGSNQQPEAVRYRTPVIIEIVSWVLDQDGLEPAWMIRTRDDTSPCRPEILTLLGQLLAHQTRKMYNASLKTQITRA